MYFRSVADTSVMVCDEIISVMDIVSTKTTINIATSKVLATIKIRHKINCYILHTVLLAMILLLLIATVNCYQYAKNRSKQKGIDALKI